MEKKLLKIRSAGTVCGDTGVFAEEIQTSNIEAIEETQILKFSVEYLEKLGFKNHKIMNNFINFSTIFLIFFVLLTSCKQLAQVENKSSVKTETVITYPLPSWSDVNSKKEMLAYVDAVTDKNNTDFIPIKDRIATFDNDGDLQMLQWTASNKYISFMLYVHHTDSVREWAYDRDSHIGRLDKDLDQALKDGWTVIDMKNNWKVIYPHELK